MVLCEIIEIMVFFYYKSLVFGNIVKNMQMFFLLLFSKRRLPLEVHSTPVIFTLKAKKPFLFKVYYQILVRQRTYLDNSMYFFI